MSRSANTSGTGGAKRATECSRVTGCITVRFCTTTEELSMPNGQDNKPSTTVVGNLICLAIFGAYFIINAIL